jgi:membrane protein implicated in regulation of membrane protease activity
MIPINHWHWLGLGAAILIADIRIRSGYLLWIGIAAVVVGLTSWVFPHSLFAWQLLLFALIGIIGAVSSWHRLHHNSAHPPAADINERSLSYIGRIFVLEYPIVDGQGRLYLDHRTWQVTGPDLPVGATVRVVGATGLVLKVEKASQA